MSFFLETKQHTEATTIKNLRLETGWKFTALLIKETECILGIVYIVQEPRQKNKSKEMLFFFS